MPAAQDALLSDSLVEVESDGWLALSPAYHDPTTGLIICPGGQVDPTAYAPVAHAIAAEGFLAAVVPMPLNLAFLAADRAMEVMGAFPEISSWIIGGHSLVGVMAASFAAGHPEKVEGLALWAAYPAGSADLSEQNIPVASIYGTPDGVTSFIDVRAFERLLAADTR